MKKFSEIENQYGLTKFLPSKLGDLYIAPHNSERIIVRKFHDPRNIENFMAITLAARKWLTENNFDDVVKVADFIEVGEDYLIRNYYLYNTSLDEILDEERIPLDLIKIQSIVRPVLEEELKSKSVIGEVLNKSLLDASSKTYFDGIGKILFVVEFRIDSYDLIGWRT